MKINDVNNLLAANLHLLKARTVKVSKPNWDQQPAKVQVIWAFL